MPFDKNTNSYNYSGTTFSKNEDVWVNEPKTIWSKETRTRMVDNPVTKYKNVKKCILNNDYNEINMVPLDKMNTIQPETKIKSSNLYIQNKKFSMDSQYMPEYVKTKNDYNYYNINDISNYTQGYAYLGKMNAPTLIGKPSLEPVIQTTQLHEDTIDNLINNNLILSTNAESFATREGYDGVYDGVTATSNSILNRLSTINNINVDISSNIVDINRIYDDLSGNCVGTPEKIQSCIKYKFSTHDNAKITKKIADKNDAYQEDLTEVQLQQNNTYVLGAITTASLLIFAIMLGRG
jgi:hypothetical protein